MSSNFLNSAIAYCSIVIVGIGLASQVHSQTTMNGSTPPAVGEQAADFELMSINGKKVSLTNSLAEGPAVVVVLRGYPGYQCPACLQQVGQFITAAAEFKSKKTRVILVYPVGDDALKNKAQEFIAKVQLPANFDFVLDPGYKLVNQYRLRWDAPKETSYPSTFVVNRDQKIVYAKISRSHGGRADIKEVIAAIP